MLAIFVATIIALVVQPVPMGVSTIVAVSILALTRTVAANQIFSGYSNSHGLADLYGVLVFQGGHK